MTAETLKRFAQSYPYGGYIYAKHPLSKQKSIIAKYRFRHIDILGDEVETGLMKNPLIPIADIQALSCPQYRYFGKRLSTNPKPLIH